MDGKYKALLDRMMVLCSKREYCESDIRKKLSQAMAKDDGESDIASDIRAADEIIIALKKDRFLDDRRYAEAFARDKSSISGWGKVKIRHALAAKGRQLLSHCSDKEFDELLHLIKKLDELDDCEKLYRLVQSYSCRQ